MKLASLFDDFIDVYFKKGLSSKFFIGFTCGIPFLLRLAILDLWLKDQGLSNSLIGILSLLQLPFTFKFLWAPFIEKFDFPFLSRIFGQRKGWAIASQMLLFIGVIGMATSSPSSSLFRLLFFTSLVSFADGCQDTSLYTFQFPKTNSKMYGPTAGVYVFGYRTGLFFSKSITLYLAHYFGWNAAYFIMAFSIFLCTLFILKIDEPKPNKMVSDIDVKQSPLQIIVSTMKQCLFDPFKSFMKQRDWKSFIAVIILYRSGNVLAKTMARLFYLDLGFSILDIANVVQVFGSIATMFGGVIGGFFIKKLGIIRSMIWFGIIHAVSCLCYVILAIIGKNLPVFYFSVFVENVTSGAVVTAFIAFIYSLSHNKNYAATQYALLWAFYDLGGTFYRTVSGIIADALGWMNFFLIIPLTFIPCLIILLSIRDYSGEPNCCRDT